MLSFDTITFTLKWNVVNVVFKFALAYMDAACLHWKIQMQWNKKLFGKVIAR